MEKTWYAIYVKSRTEKKVAAEFERYGIDYYLPLQKVLKQWSDRKKWVEEPLFKSYIFVHITDAEYYIAINVNSAVRYITIEGKAVSVPAKQIDAIRYYLNEKVPQEPEDLNWEKGSKIEIIAGSLTGLVGELVEVKGKHRVSINIESVGTSILLQIPKSKLRMIPK